MRNLIYAINITLDGCCDHTKQVPRDETYEYFMSLMRDVDVQVFGRKTYQLMVPYWPDIAKSQSETKLENEFVLAFDSLNKVVFSRTLNSAASKKYQNCSWEPSRRNSEIETGTRQKYFSRRRR